MRSFSFLIILLAWNFAFACSPVILISSNSQFGMVHRIEAALFSQPNTKPKLVHLISESVNSKDFFDQYPQACLIVPIGSQALAAVLKTNTKVPILSVLSRKNIFQHLLKLNNRRLYDPQQPITAIYLDQPLIRQLQLIEVLLPSENRQPIGVLIGARSIATQRTLQKQTQARNLSLNTIYVNKFENPVAVLDNLLNEAHVMLALPDRRIYNPKTARGILLTAFHKRVPLIGYSRTFVNNGALAAVYSSTKQMADQSAQQILTIISNPGKILPKPQYPNEYMIAVNYQVARSLGIAIDSEKALKQAMEAMNKRQLNNHG